MMDKDEPWRDWICLAAVRRVWPPEFNPLTGITKPGWTTYERCADVNGKGECAKFEQQPKTVAETPAETPEAPLTWLKRAARWIAEVSS